MKRVRPSLVDSQEHFKACHARWIQRANRPQDTTDYQEEWSGAQCMFCRYFIPLVGAFMEDYGVCSNATSQFDGIVRFEHDGCSEYEEGEWWEQKVQPDESSGH